MSKSIDELLAQSCLEEMARRAVLAVLETCSISDQLAVMDALRPSWRAWSQLVDVAEMHAERCEQVVKAARELENTLRAYERGECSRSAITVARGALAAALGSAEQHTPSDV